MSHIITPSETKHQRLSQILRDVINSGELNEDEALPSQNVLSRQYGVSTATVREALSALSQEGLITRIHGKGTFISKTGRDHAIPAVGLVTGSVALPYYAELASAIEAAALEQKLPLLVNVHSHTLVNKREKYLQMRRQNLRGVLLGPIVDQAELDFILDGQPAPDDLITFSVADAITANCVTVDNTTGVMEAVQHLVELGHRRIALVTAEARMLRWSRRRGFQQAREAYGLHEAECPIIFRDPADGSRLEGLFANQVRELVAASPRPTALLVHNDTTAIGVLHALHEAGIRVPEDISVVGCDNIRMARYAHVPLTTIDAMIDKCAHEIINMLCQVKNTEFKAGYQQKIIDTRLVVRASTGPVPK